MAQEQQADTGTKATSASPVWDSFNGELHPFLNLNEEQKRKGFRVQFLVDKPRKETPNNFDAKETDFWFDQTNLGYPLIAAQKLSAELGILEKTEGYCLRATFIVDPHGVIQWVDVNQGRVGRNVAEVIRVLDALQSDELCPCNWKKGDPYVKVG